MILTDLLQISGELFIQGQKCPHCKKDEEEYTGPDFYICSQCGCLYGNGTLQDSYQHVLPVITMEKENIMRSVPFRISCYDPQRGIVRRSGLYDPITMMITQVGSCFLY